jgi:hypothetical protein
MLNSGNEREVEAKDASLAEDVPGPEHSHEEVHHRRSERKESSCSHQNYKISRLTGNSNERFNKIKTRIILNGRSHFWLFSFHSVSDTT